MVPIPPPVISTSPQVAGAAGSYEGERDDKGREHGFGKNCFPDGSTYDGQWVRGNMEGRGAARYANGDVYEGQWKGSKKVWRE